MSGFHTFYSISFQIIPQDLSMDGEISEADDSSMREDLDSAVPFHQLLDVSANRSKGELAHRGALSQRNKPSPDALRTAILKRSVSSSSAVDSAIEGGSPGGGGEAGVLSSSVSREETPDSDSSGYNGGPASNTAPPAGMVPSSPGSSGNGGINVFQQQQQHPSMSLQHRTVPNLKPNAQANPLVQEMRMRQQHQQQSGAPDNPIPSYVNLPPAPVAHQHQQLPPGVPPHPHPKGGVAMPGFGPSPAGSPGSSSGPSLADQLKTRLEERRRSKEEIQGVPPGTGVPDRIVADVEQAVRAANDAGRV